MKKRNEGFVLLETMVVSVFVISTLVFLFVQFNNLKKSYDNSFKYNTIPGLYGVENINKYLLTGYYIKLSADVDTSDNKYIELSKDGICNSTYFSSDINYCNRLIKDLNIKTLLITKEDVKKLKIFLSNNNIYSTELLEFIKKISSKNNSEYRIIAEFNDNTFANIEVSY